MVELVVSVFGDAVLVIDVVVVDSVNRTFFRLDSRFEVKVSPVLPDRNG